MASSKDIQAEYSLSSRLLRSYPSLRFRHEGVEVHQAAPGSCSGLCSANLVGLPLPGGERSCGERAAIFAGTTQEQSIALVVLSAVLGAILGSTIGFWIGDRYGYPLKPATTAPYIGLTETKGKIDQYPVLRRQGMVGWSSLLALWLCCDRSSGSFTGANRMPFVGSHDCQQARKIAVAWALFRQNGAYYLLQRCRGGGANRSAMALAVVRAIVVVSMILYWRAQGTGACCCRSRARHFWATLRVETVRGRQMGNPVENAQGAGGASTPLLQDHWRSFSESR